MQIGDPASKVWQEWISSGRELGDITKKDAEEAAAFSASFQLNSNAQSTSEPSSRPPIAQEVQSFKARPTQADEDSPVDVKLWNRCAYLRPSPFSELCCTEPLWFRTNRREI